MDINKLDIEINAKIKSTFKELLKKVDIDIIFDNNDTDTIELIHNEHMFKLYKKSYIKEYLTLNPKYVRILSKKDRNKLNLLQDREKIDFMKKYFIFKYYTKYKLGEMYKLENKYEHKYYLSYNSIELNLIKKEYERYKYYCKHIYKIQQLYKINKELDIEQEIKIVLDEEKPLFLLNKKINEIFGNNEEKN